MVRSPEVSTGMLQIDVVIPIRTAHCHTDGIFQLAKLIWPTECPKTVFESALWAKFLLILPRR